MRIVMAIFVSGLLSGCGSAVPDFPEIWQCAFDGSPRAFYCVNTRTKERRKISTSSAQMKGAQCMSLPDYAKSEKWVDEVIQIAQQRCK